MQLVPTNVPFIDAIDRAFAKQSHRIVQIPPSTLTNETTHALNRASDIFTDCTIVVDSKDIPVHKVMLASRSPVWKKTFVENPSQNKFALNGFSSEGFKRFLRLLYSDITEYESDEQKDEVCCKIYLIYT